MKKILTGLVLVLLTSVAFAEKYTLTSKENQQMLEEAEDWMDDMPDGIQDRLSDAVSHSLHGFYSEIELFRNSTAKPVTGNHAVSVKDISGGRYGDIPMRVYAPSGKASASLPVLVYFHGGGWSLGSLSTTDRFCSALAACGNVVVISVDYPLVPEHPYPSAINTCTDATDYIFTNAKKFGGDPGRISIGGDGAGGNLALATFFNLQNLSSVKVKIRSIVLYYPLLDISQPLDEKMRRDYGRGYGFDSRLWEAFAAAYGGNGSSNDPLKNPAFAPSSLIDKLPPVLLISAGKDIVIEQQKEFGKVTNVTYVQFDNALHGFITDGAQTTAFNKAVAFTDAFLK